jgi:hypothetical protein
VMKIKRRSLYGVIGIVQIRLEEFDKEKSRVNMEYWKLFHLN